MFNRKAREIQQLKQENTELRRRCMVAEHVCARLRNNVVRNSFVQDAEDVAKVKLSKEIDKLKEQCRGLIAHIKKVRRKNIELRQELDMVQNNLESISISLEQAQHDYMDLVPRYNFLAGKVQMYEMIAGKLQTSQEESNNTDTGKAVRKKEKSNGT